MASSVACSEDLNVPTPDFGNILPGYDAGYYGDGSTNVGDGSTNVGDGSTGDGSSNVGDGSTGDGSSNVGDGSTGDGESDAGDGASLEEDSGAGDPDGSSESDAGVDESDGGTFTPPPEGGGTWTLNSDSAQECPTEPPPIPIIGGACLGIYYSCGWTNEAGDVYTCVCDWIHWLCL